MILVAARASDGPRLAWDESGTPWLFNASPCVTIGAPEMQVQQMSISFCQASVAPTPDWSLVAEPTTRDQGLGPRNGMHKRRL